MKLLVTGGLGFIGSNFIRYILNRHKTYSVINIDALTYAGCINNLSDLESNPRYRFIKENICKYDVIKNLMKDVDCCINFAAETHVDNSIANSDRFINTNILGTHVLLECARSAGLKRYIQISTDEVYGSLGEDGYFDELNPLSPNNPYSASKASADLLVMSYFKTYKLPVTIVRCSNNYGPYQHPEKFIPLAIGKLLSNEDIPVYGDGLYVRDWLYVHDNCEAIDVVLHSGNEGEIYNVGGESEKTNIEVAQLLIELTSSKGQIKSVKDRPGHDRRYAMNSDKIKSTLLWKPKTSFEKGLTDTVEWYVNNRKWFLGRSISDAVSSHVL